MKTGFKNERPEYASDELIVNYQDCCVYGRDLELLENDESWLNDTCIHFGLLDLLSSGCANNCSIVDPSVVSYLVHQCDKEDLRDFATSGCREHFGNHLPTNFASTAPRRTLIPINDTMIPGSTAWMTPGAGNHWSALLVVLFYSTTQESDHQNENDTPRASTPSISFYHMDSLPGGTNQRAAREVAAMWSLLASIYYSGSAESINKNQLSTRITEVITPCQQNGYDCGPHTLLAAQVSICLDIEPGTLDLSQSLQRKLRERQKEQPRFASDLRHRLASRIRALAGTT